MRERGNVFLCVYLWCVHFVKHRCMHIHTCKEAFSFVLLSHFHATGGGGGDDSTDDDDIGMGMGALD